MHPLAFTAILRPTPVAAQAGHAERMCSGLRTAGGSVHVGTVRPTAQAGLAALRLEQIGAEWCTTARTARTASSCTAWPESDWLRALRTDVKTSPAVPATSAA